MPISAGTFTKPKAMTPPAITVTAARMASWIHTVRGRRSMSVGPPSIRSDQRVARGVRTGLLSDGAAPLQLEFGEIAFPPRPGEQAGVDPAQCQADNERDVGEVAPEPIRDSALDPWIGGQEVEALGERGSGVGEFAEDRRDVAQVG